MKTGLHRPTLVARVAFGSPMLPLETADASPTLAWVGGLAAAGVSKEMLGYQKPTPQTIRTDAGK